MSRQVGWNCALRKSLPRTERSPERARAMAHRQAAAWNSTDPKNVAALYAIGWRSHFSPYRAVAQSRQGVPEEECLAGWKGLSEEERGRFFVYLPLSRRVDLSNGIFPLLNQADHELWQALMEWPLSEGPLIEVVLQLSVRVLNHLQNAGVLGMGTLAMLSDEDLMMLPGFKRKMVKEIRAAQAKAEGEE